MCVHECGTKIRDGPVHGLWGPPWSTWWVADGKRDHKVSRTGSGFGRLSGSSRPTPSNFPLPPRLSGGTSVVPTDGRPIPKEVGAEESLWAKGPGTTALGTDDP